MNKDTLKIKERKMRRSRRVRARITGKNIRPRLSVFHSNKYTYAQLIDDVSGKTIFGIRDSSRIQRNTKKQTAKKKLKQKTEIARDIGKKLAEAALKQGIRSVVFDRGRYTYHGRTKAVAEGAREAGLIL